MCNRVGKPTEREARSKGISRHTQGIYDVVIFSQLSQRKCSSLGKPRLSAPPALKGPAVEPRLCQSSALLGRDPCRLQRSAAPAFIATLMLRKRKATCSSVLMENLTEILLLGLHSADVLPLVLFCRFSTFSVACCRRIKLIFLSASTPWLPTTVAIVGL